VKDGLLRISISQKASDWHHDHKQAQPYEQSRFIEQFTDQLVLKAVSEPDNTGD